MLPYCRLDPQQQTSVKMLSKHRTFSFMEMLLKKSSAKWRPFYPGARRVDDLMIYGVPRSFIPMGNEKWFPIIRINVSELLYDYMKRGVLCACVCGIASESVYMIIHNHTLYFIKDNQLGCSRLSYWFSFPDSKRPSGRRRLDIDWRQSVGSIFNIRRSEGLC